MPVKFDKNKIVEDLKKGFQDIQTVAQEGNFKLFLKQFIAVLVVFLLFKYCNGKFAAAVSNYNGQMEAIRMQQTSEQEYQANKMKLISLEPRFPDVSAKNEWLLSQILGIFKAAKVTPQIEGSQTEDTSNSSYLVASLRVNSEMGFDQFAQFLAGVENREDFVKVSEFSLSKSTESDKLGSNKITLRFNTIFPKEKIAKSLFKDYDKIIKQQAEQKAQQAQQAQQANQSKAPANNEGVNNDQEI